MPDPKRPKREYTKEQLAEIAARTAREVRREELDDVAGPTVTESDVERVRRQWCEIPELAPYVEDEPTGEDQ